MAIEAVFIITVKVLPVTVADPGVKKWATHAEPALLEFLSRDCKILNEDICISYQSGIYPPVVEAISVSVDSLSKAMSIEKAIKRIVESHGFKFTEK